MMYFRHTAIAILVALAGCGDDPTGGVDHSLTTCDISTGRAGMTCERPCATHHDETGIGCPAHTANGNDVTCEGTFGVDGIIGCCVELPGTTILGFAECQ